MYGLFTLVSNRPIDERADAAARCPYCGKPEDVKIRDKSMTCVGGENHHWHRARCMACRRDFVREFRDGRSLDPARCGPGNVWYVDETGLVLKGMPSCFESYRYTCAHCGDVVQRVRYDLNGLVTTSCCFRYEDGKQIKLFRTYYRCTGCAKEIEMTTEPEQWNPSLGGTDAPP